MALPGNATRRPSDETCRTAGSRDTGLQPSTGSCWMLPARSIVRRPMQHASASRAAAKPSLLAKALDRNPAMVEAAIRLHQEGAIPPSTHLIDLDAVANNASDCGGSSAVQRGGVCHDEAGWPRAPYDAARTRPWFRRCHCGRGDAGVSHPPLRLPPRERGTYLSTASRRG